MKKENNKKGQQSDNLYFLIFIYILIFFLPNKNILLVFPFEDIIIRP